MTLTYAALALGWPAAWLLAKIASRFFYGIAPHDAVTFTLVPIMFGVTRRSLDFVMRPHLND